MSGAKGHPGAGLEASGMDGTPLGQQRQKTLLVPGSVWERGLETGDDCSPGTVDETGSSCSSAGATWEVGQMQFRDWRWLQL